MQYRPRVNVRIDAEKDVTLFRLFLDANEWYPKRKQITTFYPRIEAVMHHRPDFNGSVGTIVRDMYARHHDSIEKCARVMDDEILQSEPAFAALGKCMACADLGRRSFSAIPTLLPFSPLDPDRSTFMFSVARDVAGFRHERSRYSVIAVHEISHFIFFDQLQRWCDHTKKHLNDAAIHYFKEALTAAVMDEDEFRIVFDYAATFSSSGRYPGNPELQGLLFSKDGREEGIVEMFKREIVRAADGYRAGLDKMLGLFSEVGGVLATKWKLWNEISREPNKQGELLTMYRQPIQVDGCIHRVMAN
jgi:hypothetical protein